MGDRGRRINVFKADLSYITILRPVWAHKIFRLVQEMGKKEVKEWETENWRKGKERKNMHPRLLPLWFS